MANETKIKPTALCLGGGGAKGAFQIGAWQALEEAGLLSDVQAAAGCSVGALNAALFALGDLNYAKQVWESIKPADLLAPGVDGAFFSRDGLIRIIDELPLERISDSKIRVHVSVKHMETGEPVFFELNGLTPASTRTLLLASSAMPHIYAPEHYLGAYVETPIAGKLSFMGEYVHNNNHDKPGMTREKYGYACTGSRSSTDGYLLSLSYGAAREKGDFLTTLNYFNVDENLFMDSGYTAYDDYVGSRGIMGFGLSLDYMTSKHTKLSLERYWAHTKPVAGNIDIRRAAPVEKEPYYTTYLKFTSKF